MKKRILSIVMAATLTIAMLSGCGATTGTTAAGTSASNSAGASEDYSRIKIGCIINTTHDDGGWIQAEYTSLLSAMNTLGMSESQMEYVEGVAETGTDCANAAESLIADGCNVILGLSTGYKSAMEELAAAHPDIQFGQADGTSMNGNLVGFQIRSYEAMFLLGYLCAKMSPTDELGYSAGMPEASVIQGINAYALGAKYANENSTVRLVFCNSWYDPEAEAECANTLISLGITYMGINASSPAIPQACESAGVYCTGYHVDMQSYAPGAVLVSYMWNWTPIFEDMLTKYAKAGAPIEEDYYWGAAEGCATISDFNSNLVPEDLQADVLAVQQQIVDGKLSVLAGEIKDNQGNVIVESGSVMSDDVNRRMDFLVDNVVGQLP
jgi:basic membrane lipoprotein Med (substrate-binding protein (PBP1-ABC) superfamily)